MDRLEADLRRDQAAILEECGPEEPPVDRDRPGVHFRSGHYRPIVARFRELQKTVRPRGILGPQEEKELWTLWQYMVRIALMKGQTWRAWWRLRAYEKGRIEVNLTPIPDFDLQEAVLGYYAARNPDKALRKLQCWLEHSRMPVISGVVRDHPSFRHLFADRPY